MVNLAWHIKRQIRLHRKNVLVRTLSNAANAYLEAYHNEGNFSFDENGERRFLEKVGAWSGNAPIVIWDVGAHEGEWADLAHAYFPAAHIFSFEIVPDLCRRIPTGSWRSSHEVGLSDREGLTDVTYAEGWDTANAIEPRRGHLFYEHGRPVQCRLARGDTMIAQGVRPPELLKIDTEGHEVPVLRGLSGLLSTAPPIAIQFEYGQTWLPGAYRLKDAFDCLSPAGYRIGRLHPMHVEFFDYEYSRDDFRMGNMIAVRSAELERLLS